MLHRGLDLSGELWACLISELAARGEGRREAGAFLLADRRFPHRVTEAAFYDDLEPGSLNGAVHLTGRGYQRLWDRCDDANLQVVGDIHTHPGPSTAQSSIDRANPMLDRANHIAMIVPHYATTTPSIRDAGVHRHLGGTNWESLTGWRRWRHIRVQWR